MILSLFLSGITVVEESTDVFDSRHTVLFICIHTSGWHTSKCTGHCTRQSTSFRHGKQYREYSMNYQLIQFFRLLLPAVARISNQINLYLCHVDQSVCDRISNVLPGHHSRLGQFHRHRLEQSDNYLAKINNLFCYHFGDD